MNSKTRRRLENLMVVLAVGCIAAMALTDPIVAEWIADRLLEWME